jgi:transposase InsO family protein
VTKYQLAQDLSSKTGSTQSLYKQIDFVQNQFDLRVLTIHTDNEQTLSDFFSEQAAARGINLETTPPYQPNQNGYAKRYSALISKIARQMTINANLPARL